MIVAMALMSLASCGDDDGTVDSTPTTTEEPAPATTEATEPTVTETHAPTTTEETGGHDDLCGWATDDEVVEFVTAAGFVVAGPASASDPLTDDATVWGCAWTFASGEELQLGVSDRPGRLDSLQELDVVVEYVEPGQIMEPGATIYGHPALSEGVVVENNAFGRFSFYTPGTDQVLNLVFLTEEVADEEGCETALMALADSVLGDLGWVPVQGDTDCEFGSLAGEWSTSILNDIVRTVYEDQNVYPTPAPANACENDIGAVPGGWKWTFERTLDGADFGSDEQWGDDFWVGVGFSPLMELSDPSENFSENEILGSGMEAEVHLSHRMGLWFVVQFDDRDERMAFIVHTPPPLPGQEDDPETIGFEIAKAIVEQLDYIGDS